MSAIKKQSIEHVFTIFLLLILFSCDPKKEIPSEAGLSNEISFIGFSKVGGKDGNYNIVKITKDSIKLEQGSTTTQKHKQWANKISTKDWKKLTSCFDVYTLDLIKSSESIQAQEQMDETFQIKTSKKSHVYVNAYNDCTHYEQFEKFKSQLDNILPKEYK